MNNPAKILFHGISGKIRLVVGICFLAALLILSIFIYSSLEDHLISIYEANLKNTTKLLYQMTELYVSSFLKNYSGDMGPKTIDMNALESKISQLKIGRNGYPFIMDSKGNLLIYPDKKKQGTNIYNNKDVAGKKYIAEICESVLKESTANPEENIDPQIIFYAGESPDDKNPVNKIAAFYYYKDMDWIIFSSAPVAEIYESSNSIKRGSIWIVVMTFFISHIIIAFFIYLILRPLANIKKTISLISSGDLNRRLDVSTNDEMGEITDQLNTLLDGFLKVLNRIKKSAASLFDSVHDLSASSRQISSTSNEQAAAVKEIVSTMEDSDTLARSIAEKINSVTETAGRMKETVDSGFAITRNSLSKMDEIRQSNTETIAGVQALSSRIGSIWEIVNIINSIADQTRIIAFNAELEASAAGEAGKNFQIVATEIRRLADNTVNSTNEIKKKIQEIQNSSDNLIIASEEGTTRIKEGWKLSRELQEVFDNIRGASETSAHSAGQIALSINQQVAAFEQILLTLKQISEGIDNLVESTKTTSRESEKLREMADSLNAVVDEYIHTNREKDL